MFSVEPRKKPAVIVFIIILALIPLNFVFGDFLQWSITGNILYFPADNGINSDPAPILPSLGFSLSFHLWGPLRLELTEDIYFTNYEYNSAFGYPMACNPENRSALVIGFLTAVQVTGYFTFGNTVLRAYAGPAADIRLITLSPGLKYTNDFTGNIETDPKLQTEAIGSYFWSEGRWLMPVVGSGADFQINDKFMLGFDIRVWMPVYKLWTNDNTSGIDGWRFGVGLRITPRSSAGRQQAGLQSENPGS